MRDWADYVSPISFMEPDRIVDSAWVGHTPFAYWIVEALAPRRIVELGTFRGHSFYAFCQAVKTLGLATEVVGIDHWQGDVHAGFYSGESMYREVSEIARSNYSAIGRLVRSTFDAAVAGFEDGSIDLLHIDGRHRYEDVAHDFATWRPKLSERGVVLFHDTQVRTGDFGVWRFFPELTEFPRFEFVHSHGLGVAKVGTAPLPALDPLFAAPVGTQDVVRAAYGRLGGALVDRLRGERLEAELTKLRSSPRAMVRAIRKMVLRQSWRPV